jgi:hypothetical protein
MRGDVDNQFLDMCDIFGQLNFQVRSLWTVLRDHETIFSTRANNVVHGSKLYSSCVSTIVATEEFQMCRGTLAAEVERADRIRNSRPEDPKVKLFQHATDILQNM